MHNKCRALLPIFLLGLCLQPMQAEPSTFVAATYGQPQQLVAVQGTRRLNVICIGRGEPTVIFLYGLGSGSFDWRKVQPAIGKITKTCAYDRAGNGFSDPADDTSDATNAISDLHALYHMAGVSKRILLVGHSLGGFYATLYAETYPDDVAGMLLVDPAFEGQAQAIAQVVGAQAAQQLVVSQRQTEMELAQCIALARSGRLSAPAEAKSDCLDNPPDADPDLHREKNRELETATYETALSSEYHAATFVNPDGLTLDDAESKHASASLGSIPLVILTRGNLEHMPGLSPDEQGREEAAWKAGHDRLATLSSNGLNIVVPHTGHYVQLDQPGIVIDQIKGLIEKIRR